MAKATGRDASEIARRAVLDCLEDWEDAEWAADLIANETGKSISLEALMRQFEEQEQAERAAKPAAE
jgi:hypothetical protein